MANNKPEKKPIAEILNSSKYFGSVQGKIVKFYSKKVGNSDVYDIYLQDGSGENGNAEIKVGVWNPSYEVEEGIMIECWGLYESIYNGVKSLNMKKDGSGSKIIDKITFFTKSDTKEKETTSTKKKDTLFDNSGGIPFDPVRFIEVIQENTEAVNGLTKTITDSKKVFEMESSNSLVTVLNQFKEFMSKFMEPSVTPEDMEEAKD